MKAATILDQILDPFAECLTPEAAERIVGYRVDDETRSRVEELADKASEGRLADDEREEYRELVDAFDMVAALKSRAREILSRAA
jgi:hypothetical protein